MLRVKISEFLLLTLRAFSFATLSHFMWNYIGQLIPSILTRKFASLSHLLQYLSGQLIGHFTRTGKIHRCEIHPKTINILSMVLFKTQLEKLSLKKWQSFDRAVDMKKICMPEVSRSASTAIYRCSSVLLEAVFHFWGVFLNLELIAERNVCFMLMDWADSITRMRLLQLIKLRLGRWARARHSATGGHRSASTTTRHNQNQSRAEKMRWERPSESL